MAGDTAEQVEFFICKSQRFFRTFPCSNITDIALDNFLVADKIDVADKFNRN
ncbi:MAG TPA: hypothetical protein VFC43_08140 [Methanoregula sp.]|nr:hypothetical protein [Methanoregula sp.]